MNETVRQEILKLLRPSDDPRWLEKLQAMGLETILPVLSEAVTDEQAPSPLRGRAAIALGHLRDVRAIPALVAALDAGDVVLRGRAAQALGRVGETSPLAVERLVDRLADADAYVRRSAAEALGQIGSAEALPALKKIAQSDVDESNRLVASNAVNKIEGNA